jgi:hypothetical protein
MEFTRQDSDRIAQTHAALVSMKETLPAVMKACAEEVAKAAAAIVLVQYTIDRERCDTDHDQISKLVPTVGLMKWFVGGLGLSALGYIVNMVVFHLGG